MNNGDEVKFVYISESAYNALPERDGSTVYFITSTLERRIAIGDTLFANYVPAHCTSLSLSVTSDELSVGDSFMLVAITEPANPSDPITFTASNNNVTITPASTSDRIIVEAAAIGQCVITCTCENFSATCSLDIHAAYQYVEHVLAENYTPDGVTFKYTIPSISFANGDYIEISIDLSTVSGTKENILSVGQNIDVWQGSNTGPRMHNYVTATNKQKISVDLINNTNTRRPTYNSPGTDYLVTINKRGVYLNGVLFDFNNGLRATPTLDYQVGIAALLSLTTVDIGSQEGSNRSHATYNYIKYYTVETV